MFQNKIINNKLIRQNNNNSGLLNNVKKPNNNLYTKEYEINDVRIAVRNILTKVSKRRKKKPQQFVTQPSFSISHRTHCVQC